MFFAFIFTPKSIFVKRILLITTVAAVAIAACNNQPKQESQPVAVAVTTADAELMARAQDVFQPLPSVAINPENPITAEKTELGKLLYYDTRLSKTGNNSCNSCHNLATYGVDNLPTSKGDNGGFGDRNSPTVLNAALHSFQFWDGRAKDVEEQAGGPIINPVEMAIPSKDFLVAKLKDIKEYQEMFKAAFPAAKDAITYDNVQKAIAAFERTLITPSPFDKYLAGNHSAMTSEQKIGLKTFMNAGCTQCHTGSSLGGSTFQKFGVYGDYRELTHSKTDDAGKWKITKLEADRDMFKVPGLRNIAKTHPYFHDGSVADLEEAIRIMGKLQVDKELTEAQVKSIAAFLNALTGEVPAEAQKIPALLVAQK